MSPASSFSNFARTSGGQAPGAAASTQTTFTVAVDQRLVAAQDALVAACSEAPPSSIGPGLHRKQVVQRRRLAEIQLHGPHDEKNRRARRAVEKLALFEPERCATAPCARAP